MRYLDAAGVRQLKELNDAAYVGKEEYNDDTMVISAALNDLNGRVTTAESEIAGFSEGDENIIETVKVNGTALTVTDKAVDVTVPTTLASLTDDSTHRLVTDTEKTKLQGIAAGAEVNVQSDWSVTDSTSDAYIVNKPTIPTKVSDLTNDSGFTTNTGTITGVTMNGVSKGTSGVVDLGTVITDVSGKADASAAIGTLSLAIDNTNYQITLSGTKVDGTTFTVSNVIDLPLESVVVNGSYNNTTKKVVLTLQNGNTVDFSVADLVAGLQSEITSTNKLSADLISDGTTNKVVTATEKSTWNGKEDTSNKVTSISSSSTDVQYPSAKCVYDEIADAAYIGEPQGSTTYTSGGAVVDLSNYVQTSNIKTINNQSILGSGNLTITGEQGDDGVGISSVVQTTESTVSGGTNVITINKTDGTSSTFNVRNGDAVGSATIVQTIGPATDATISQAAITGFLDDPYGIGNSYKYVTWTNGTLANDGTINTSGYGSVSEYLPVAPEETLVLNNIQTVKLAYYDASKSFLSLVNTNSGLNDYTVPTNARFARFQYDGMDCALYYYPVRRISPENKSFSDLILSPLKTRPYIGFTGDSNTSGYGLASGDKSWANLIIDALTGISTMRYDMNSRWVEALGYKEYSGQSNFRAGCELSIWTDAISVTLEYSDNYDSAWKWYVDGVESGTASSTAISLDGSSHKVTVKFSAGQLTFPRFIIPKAITCQNTGQFGVAITNMPFNSGYDWIFIMIGTNHRVQYYINDFKFGEYAGKGFYVVPFPNHRSESEYVISELQAYTFEMEMFRGLGYEIVNLADANGAAFLGDTYYQSDGIHFNASGHKVIANMVMGRLGLPLYLKA